MCTCVILTDQRQGSESLPLRYCHVASLEKGKGERVEKRERRRIEIF
jgi:hypothetical protein